MDISPFTHYVVRNMNVMRVLELNIQNWEPFLYVGATPTTPPDFNFIFIIRNSGKIVYKEESIDYKYFNDKNVKEKLIKISKEFNRERLLKELGI